MTTKLVTMCDHKGCDIQAVIPNGRGVWDIKGWGATKILGREEYCPIHWPQYCKDNDIDPETGQYN